jgi:hypothetical protein
MEATVLLQAERVSAAPRAASAERLMRVETPKLARPCQSEESMAAQKGQTPSVVRT